MVTVRKNPWQRFKATQGEAMLRWVTVGNVAVMMNDPHAPRDSRGRTGATLWCQTPALLREALAYLGVYAQRFPTTPFPHAPLTGKPLERALDECQYARPRRLASRD